jgi:SpoVK/Ycf46/Vps4 family AAA+-type ATPase
MPTNNRPATTRNDDEAIPAHAGTHPLDHEIRLPRPSDEGPECELPADAETEADHRNPGRAPRRERIREENEEPTVGRLEYPRPEQTLERLILFPECRAEIMAGLRAIEKREEFETCWNISRIQPQEGRCIINFWGLPGTGKTLAAKGVALRVNKPLYIVDYAAVISKYLGDTAKHIKTAFAEAREFGAVMFFDEADSLLSRRVSMGESCGTSINQNRNVLMQELDGFDSICIMATNLFGNYDPAILRRVARHIRFKLPDEAMRVKLLEMHLPNLQRVNADLNYISKEAKGLSGGDILNVCVNAIYAGSMSDNTDEWKVGNDILLREIEAVKTAKAKNDEGA